MSDDPTLDEFVESETSSNEEGFIETAAGKIPVDWSTTNVERVCELQNGEATDHVEIGAEPYLVYGSNGAIGSYTESNFEGGLIFGRVGAVGEIERVTEPVWVSDNAIQAQVSGDINAEYLYYCLTDKELSALATKTAQPLLNQSTIGNVTVPIPPLSEQQKIATVLHTVDQAIQKLKELIEQSERVKLGLTQDLMSRGINNESVVKTDSRFDRIPESWELRRLCDVGEIVGRTAPKKDDTECWGGDIPWATPSEITSLGGPTISDTKQHLTEVAIEKVSSNILPPKSVLLTTRATIGECAVNTTEMTTNQGFKNLIPSDSLDTWYSYYRLSYEGDYLASLSKGSTFPEIGKDTVENFMIPVPPLDEQYAISKRLKSVDEQILLYKKNRNQLQRLKQGLMQDLLSGEVRTTDADIDIPEEVAKYG